MWQILKHWNVLDNVYGLESIFEWWHSSGILWISKPIESKFEAVNLITFLFNYIIGIDFTKSAIKPLIWARMNRWSHATLTSQWRI